MPPEKGIEKLFSCENLDKFINSIRFVLPYKGYSDSKFFICEYNNVEFLIKLSFYKKTDPEIYSSGQSTGETAMNPVDAEINTLILLKKELIDKNCTPCILEIICHKKCEDIFAVVKNQKKCDEYVTDPPKNPNVTEMVQMMFCRQYDAFRSGLTYKTFSFLVLEECDITFNYYLTHFVDDPVSLEVLQTLLFQIIYTIYAINRIFPEFRHRDLHANNVMLKFDNSYQFDPANPKYIVFNSEKRRYVIPYFGIICKIIDFGFASIPEKGIISAITRDKYMMHLRTDNDLLYFFSDIYLLSPNQRMIDNILSQIEPTRSYIHFNTDYIKRTGKNIPDSAEMLESELFQKYTKKNINKINIWHEYGIK